MRLVLPLAVAAATCSACSVAPAKKMTLHDQRQNVLDRIADKCGLPRSFFSLVGDDELTPKPDPNVEYLRVDCALQGIKNSRIPFRLGFIGNEAYVGNAQ